MAGLTVSAPLVVATTDAGFSVYLYRGDVLPDNVSKESVERLKSLGMLAGKDDFVAQPDGAQPAAEQAEPEGSGDPPGGNASLDDWQDFARSQGASEEDLVDRNRNDLRDEFGK